MDTTPTPVMFAATVSASGSGDALAKVTRRMLPGFAPTGRIAERSARHMLWTVEVEGAGDVNDLWVALTSYGITPSDDLGSVWQTVPGVGR